MTDKICKIDSCTRQVNARGWCSMHYCRWFNTGSPLRFCLGCGSEVQDGRTRWCSTECKPPCTFDGCTKRAYASNGLCSGHDRQLREGGELRPFKFTRPEAGGKCVVCDAQIPKGHRRTYCSDACKQRWHHHNGSRPTNFTCRGCGTAVSLVTRGDKGHLRRSDAKWCIDCLDDDKRRRIYRYGITPEQYKAAITAGCEICGKMDVKLHVDHDHNCCPDEYTCGNCTRGFLCGSCNRAVGLLNDNADHMLAAAVYVLKNSDVLRCATLDLEA